MPSTKQSAYGPFRRRTWKPGKTLERKLGHDKTPVRLPRTSEFLCGASRSPWQLARRASEVEPENLKCTFSDFTLRYFGLIIRRLPFVVHSKGETAHRIKKSGQIRINSGQVDHSLPQGQAENLVFVAPCETIRALDYGLCGATLSLPRVLNFKFSCSIVRNITLQSIKNLAFQ